MIFFSFFLVLLPGDLIASDDPILSFSIQDASGEHDAANLFMGRWIVFSVIGHACPGVEPFLSFRKRVPDQQKDYVLILCVGGDRQKIGPNVATASDEAAAALGLTGTPMILGIEDHRVKWRIAGLIPHWQSFASNWIRKDNE